MARFYIEYTPARRGLTGREYLGQSLDETFPDVSFTGLFSNGLIEFGYVEAESEQMCNVLNFYENSFSIKRLFTDEFRGAGVLYSNLDSTALADLFLEHDITAGDSDLDDAKAYKTKMLKEVTKKRFNDYNDLVANISKEILLLEEYKDTLDAGQTTRLENALTSLKGIYDAETCLQALEEDVTKIAVSMPQYYSTKTSINNATSIEDLNLIELVA